MDNLNLLKLNIKKTPFNIKNVALQKQIAIRASGGRCSDMPYSNVTSRERTRTHTHITTTATAASNTTIADTTTACV